MTYPTSDSHVYRGFLSKVEGSPVTLEVVLSLTPIGPFERFTPSLGMRSATSRFTDLELFPLLSDVLGDKNSITLMCEAKSGGKIEFELPPAVDIWLVDRLGGGKLLAGGQR